MIWSDAKDRYLEPRSAFSFLLSSVFVLQLVLDSNQIRLLCCTGFWKILEMLLR